LPPLLLPGRRCRCRCRRCARACNPSCRADRARWSTSRRRSSRIASDSRSECVASYCQPPADLYLIQSVGGFVSIDSAHVISPSALQKADSTRTMASRARP